jgi:hypothetical protein
MKLLYKKSMFLLYSVLVFFTPLVVIPMTQESFEFPKMMLVYALSLIVLFLYLSHSIYVAFFTIVLLPENQKVSHGKKSNNSSHASKVFQTVHKMKNSSFFKIVIPFVLFSFVSVIFSQDIYTSIFGYYSRFNGGLLSLVSFVVLSYISYKTFEKNDYVNLFLFSILSLILVSIYGVWQYYMNTSIIRVYSTIGQPNWLAQYLGMFLPLITYFYLKTPFIYSKVSDFIKDSFILILFVLVFYAFWLTFSMSAIFALAVSLLFLVKTFFKSIYLKKVFIIFFISLFVISLNFGFFTQRLSDVFIDVKNLITIDIPDIFYVSDVYAQKQSSPSLNNTTNKISGSYNISDPGFIRGAIWKGSLSMIIENPKVLLFGRGLQTFPYEFQKFRSSILNYTSEWDFVINRPHNYYLELFIEIGLLGILGYLFILKFLFDNITLELKPSLLVFYITNMFGWPVVYTNLLFWMLFSYVCYLKLHQKSKA